MKTLTLTCLSCVVLAGVYFMLNNRSQVNKLLSFTQPESASLAATPVAQQEVTRIKMNLDAETSLAPVETLPTEASSIPVINAAASSATPVEKTSPKTSSNTLIDSNWINYAVFQQETATEATAAAPATAPDPVQNVVNEEENSYVHTPFLDEEQEEAVADPILNARRLIMKLNTEMADSVARYNAPDYVSANSIAQHAVVVTPEKIVTDAVLENEEKSGVQYVPSHLTNSQAEAGRETYSYTLLYDRAEKIKHYAARKGFDTSFAFLIDMGMKSTKKRFFVMDLNTMTIIKRGMVAHGRGNSTFTFNKTYSNSNGSNCTSLGIYKVGAMYKGNYGLSYKLMGLEGSNSNAYKRSIILHGMSCIPNEESEYPICQSEGCPSLSPAFLKEITPIISTRHKPMLLWIYDPLSESIEEEMVANY